MTSPSALFFFYGSLRSGYWNNGILSDEAVRLGPAQTTKGFNLFIGMQGHVPTCSPAENGVPLIGELYALNPRDASNVYRLETGYEAGQFEVVMADGTKHEATIFHHRDPLACYYLSGQPRLIPSGNYADAILPDGRQKTVAPVVSAANTSPESTTASSDTPEGATA